MDQSIVQKRPREELEEYVVDFEESSSKRHKPYNHILSLLESEELEDSTQDLSPLITTLEKEITCASSLENDSNTLLVCKSQEEGNYQDDPKISNTNKNNLEEGEKERVMRHLLQASDDELGIPNPTNGGDWSLDFDEFGFNGADGFPSLCDKMWELEDEVANYHALLQSEIFLWEQ